MAYGYGNPSPDTAQPQPMFGDVGALGQGMFGGLRRGFRGGANALHPYSNRLLLAGLGMLGGGPSDAMKGLVAGSALDTEDADRTKLNAAIQGLMDDTSGGGILEGISPAERSYLLASPPTLSKVIADRMSPPSAGVNVFAGDYKIPTGYRAVDPNDPSAGVEKVPGVETETVTNRKVAVNNAVTAISDQLNRYEELVGKYGVEAVPGPAKDQLLTVRRGLQLQLKELFNLGVLNGPDLELMDSMLWDPSVGGSGAGNIPSQLYTGATGGAAERAKTSAAELRRIVKSIQDSVEGKSSSEGHLTPNDDGTLTWSP